MNMTPNDFPAHTSLEAALLTAMIESDKGVTYLDLVGTGITEENIDEIALNLRMGTFETQGEFIARNRALTS